MFEDVVISHTSTDNVYIEELKNSSMSLLFRNMEVNNSREGESGFKWELWADTAEVTGTAHLLPAFSPHLNVSCTHTNIASLKIHFKK